MRWLRALAPVLGGLLLTRPALALEPRDVFVVYNTANPQSRDVAMHYVRKRAVPEENLVALDLPTSDDISRADYDARLRGPLREALKGRRDKAKVLLTVFGVPLRVGPQAPNDREKVELAKVKDALEKAQAENQKLLRTIRVLEEEAKKDPSSPLKDAIPAKQTEQQLAAQKVAALEEQQRRLSHTESQAAVDSELMLLWWDDYPLARWVFNPLYFQFPDAARRGSPPVVMTCRLDGPNADVAKRLVDDAVAVERKGGLVGKVYVDARGIKYAPEADRQGTGYAGYDESMREAAKLLKDAGKLDVTLDDQEALFPVGACRECALYCGWYAVRQYRACCRFVPGAVAWHLASFEAVSLRNPDKQWAGNLLLDGAAATLGPVDEPYTVGFPKPAEFFGFLVSGEYALVECHARSTLLTSWMMVLVGDPLYTPYAGKASRLKSAQVLPSPAGAARIVGG